MWVIGGQYNSGATWFNDVWKSTDGINWNEKTASAAFSGRSGQGSVVFNAGGGLKMWVIGGTNNTSGYLNDVWNSSDGITWNFVGTAPFATRQQFGCLVYNGYMWVIGGIGGGGQKGDVWYSADGSTWNQATASAAFGARSDFSTAVFNDGGGLKMWVIGGFNSVQMTMFGILPTV